MNGSSTSKTPAASSKQRRALGDISNRKQARSNGAGGGSQALKKTPGLRQRNPVTTKTPALNKKKEVTFLPRPTQVKQAPSVLILPDLGSSKATNNSQTPAQKNLPKSKSKTTLPAHDPVDDIERSAGRLWIDEPDDYSCGSVSLPEINWEATRKRQLELRIKKKEEEEAQEEAEYNAYIEKTFEDDGKWKCSVCVVESIIIQVFVPTCIDSILRAPESEGILGADVWIERTLSFDFDQEAELTFEAPSFCGDISF